ncbi:restriction endonuclease [Bacillus pseudomycoides]|uniref:Restriction endonuclease n=2 Tax=Bacillus pseudomycoides TaxID=64104 RepID=A0ABD6T650_9BACI|nr:restriction endonuclease [Bacillus pseudomycoides]PDZ71744.1 restriction endonuclease [Bacillus pseudomycoides]PEF22495.1 restriction endonuclease [Bacillus pseudomycoides]PEO91033.1 restriction endonuclease [Bacillus pseudomycoides]PEP87309.1 restriction endonuclease [Bacillus pseudomycoides]
MMVSPLSGSNRDIELVKIETADLSLTIKGNPYHEKYESLKKHQSIASDEMMHFHVSGTSDSIMVYDAQLQKLSELTEHPPIFFENRSYQLVVVPKNDQELSFYHEHPSLRKAISSTQMGSLKVLMGNLSFPNEVGYTTFEIRDDKKSLLTVTLEIFPSKLDYKDDYRALLEEVNDEIYNLAFHLLKRTYLGASTIYATNPSKSEFYHILNDSFHRFMKAISHIKRQPHHALTTRHQLVQGEKIRRLDSVGMNYLRKRPHLFQEVGRNMLPSKGITAYKEVSYDTLENRFVKWMVQRVIHKIEDLLKSLEKDSGFKSLPIDDDLIQNVRKMKSRMKNELNDPFWNGIGKLDRSVFSLVIQMAAGYRDAYQIFLMLSRGLTLRGQIFKMSVKDVARLYEYWTYLKLGQILSKKYETVNQDIIKVRQDGLYVTLDESKTAKRTFRHPETDEVIELYFQKRNKALPTVTQKPDTMLAIEKKGKNYQYQYIFDAKYRIDFAKNGSHYKRQYGTPGPMEEDINTMHRYRDALVVDQGGPFERTAYGAYVLFPWNQEEEYEHHPFYKSIEKVNIGGFPFLPNATRLVEQFLDHLIEKSPEEIIREGILPRGTKEEWESSLDEKVLVGNVKTEKDYETYMKEGFYQIPVSQLKPGWQEIKYIALYAPKKWYGENGGIQHVARIKDIHINRENVLPGDETNDCVYFELEPWKKLGHHICPVGYGIQTYMLTSMSLLKEVQELPELFMKSKEERALWKTLRRFTKQVKVELDHSDLDKASSIKGYYVQDVQIKIDYEQGNVMVGKGGEFKELALDLVVRNSSMLFKSVLGQLSRD